MRVDAAGSRAMRLVRFRPDVEWSRYCRDSPDRWVARDPISLEYFYFSDLERKLALALDGNKTLPDIAATLEFASLTHATSLEWVGSLLARFEDACLLVQDQPESGQRLASRMRRRSRRSWLAVLLSPLAIRIPLLDPTPWLQRISLPASLTLNWCTVSISLVLAAMIGSLAVTKLLDGSAVLDPLPQLLAGERLIWLVLCYVCVKSLHELGHALACRRFGAECHDIGILFLFFTPCLYCDVSDTWKLASRWRRAAVAAAGIYVELILAAIAAAVWMTTEPGALQALAVNVMLVCSVGTILINANPLLKYDGYYVLSDLWGVPNLAEQSQEVLQESIASWFSGASLPKAKWDAHAFWLGLYGVSAFIYRHLILAVILWAIHAALVPLGLGIVALMLTATIIAGLVLSWWKGLKLMSLKLLYGPTLRLSRVFVFAALAAAVVTFVSLVPLPTSVRSRAVNSYVRLEPIFASQTSRMVFASPTGTRVRLGEKVLALDAPEQRIELLRVMGGIAQLTERREHLQIRSVDDPDSIAELPTIVEALAEKQKLAASLQNELSDLEVRAPLDGIVIRSPFDLPPPLTAAADRVRNASPLDASHLGCTIERGTLVGWIASETDGFRLEAFVSERDAELIRLDAHVRCQWDCAPSEIYRGIIERISPEPLSETPDELIGDAQFISIRNGLGSYSPEHPSYRVQVRLEQVPAGVVHGSLANVHIEVTSRTLLQTLWRVLKQSFKFIT